MLYSLMQFIELIPSQITILLFLAVCGLFLRFSLVYCGQYWANTYHHLATYMLLPCIAFVITTVIANNIALSLGMIGALSIVRFRHPVKSPLELIMYFALITVGIATSVRTKWAIQLIIGTILIILIVKFFQVLSKKYGKSFYNTSFNEGVNTNTLEIVAKNKIELIEKNDYLISSFNDIDDKKIIYRLNFENKKELQLFKETIEKSDQIEKINTIYN